MDAFLISSNFAVHGMLIKGTVLQLPIVLKYIALKTPCNTQNADKRNCHEVACSIKLHSPWCCENASLISDDFVIHGMLKKRNCF